MPFTIASVVDSYFIDRTRRPNYHVVNIEIVPEHPLAVFTYAGDFKGGHIDVTITEGDDKGYGPIRADGDGRASFDIALYPSAEAGVKRLIGFSVELGYRYPPTPNFKRHTGPRGFGRWELAVCFAVARLPARVYWAEWTGEGDDAHPIEGTEVPIKLVPLDEDDPNCPLAARVVQENVPADKVLGIGWEW